MKKKPIEKAISTLRTALREKFEVSAAQIIIKEDCVSLDDDQGNILCNDVLEDAVAEELETD